MDPEVAPSTAIEMEEDSTEDAFEPLNKNASEGSIVYVANPSKQATVQRYAYNSNRQIAIRGVKCFCGFLVCIGLLSTAALLAGWGISGQFLHNDDPTDPFDHDNQTYLEMYTNFKAIADASFALMDKTKDPCNDFMGYAAGKWYNRTTLQPGQNRVMLAFGQVEASNMGLVREIIDDQWPIVTPYYTSCTTGYQKYNFSALKDMHDLLYYPTTAMILFKNLGRLRYSYGVDVSGFSFYLRPEIDIYDPTVRILTFWQGDVTLTNAEFYDPETSPISLSEYREYIRGLFALSTVSIDDAGIDNIIEFERTIASFRVSDVAIESNASEIYNKVAWNQMSQVLAPEIVNYATLLRYIPNASKTFFSLATPDYFEQLNAFLNVVPFAVLKNVALYNFYKETYPLLNSTYVTAAARLQYLLQGTQMPDLADPDHRARVCAYNLLSSLELLMGHYFVQKAGIDATYKEHVTSLIDDIRLAFGGRLVENTWMDSATKNAAIKKLEDMRVRSCFPDDWALVSEMEQRIGVFDPANYFNNSLRVWRAYDNRSFVLLTQPVDPNEWGFGNSLIIPYSESPEIVNAFYNPLQNEIIIPAGIARAPFLYSYSWQSAPMSSIYGGLGWVIGHEITHGFDNNGREYDEIGARRQWWSLESEQRFLVHAQCIVATRNTIETTIPGLYVNGRSTLGENIADAGGLQTALDAMLAKRESLTEAELELYDAAFAAAFEGHTEVEMFFVFAAQIWPEKMTNETLIELIENDPHAPPEARVLGAFRDNPRFAREFQCSDGDLYYSDFPCELW